MKREIIDIRLLGPLEVWIGDQDYAPTGRTRRVVLGLLALNAGQVVETEVLLDRVWNGSPPATGRTSLQVHIGHIRKSLPNRDLLTTVNGGYRLEVAAEQVDVTRFAATVRDGLKHLEGQSFSAAADLLVQAIDQWRDPPLADLAHLEATHLDIVELSSLFQEAQLGLCNASLELAGRTPDLASLERLVEAYPMDERAWDLLIVGKYRSEGQAKALEALDRAAHVLGSELGVRLGPGLRARAQQIRNQDPNLQPVISPTVDLPSFTTPFFGRIDAARRLSKEIPGQRLTTLVGTGGIGKTRLAVEAARLASGEFTHGVSFIALEAVDDQDLVSEAMCRAISPERSLPTANPAELIGNREYLLVIDNCEHVQEAVGRIVVDLLRRCPSLTVLATSRSALGVKGEAVWEVAPFQTPEPGSSLDDLNRNEAVTFFVESARRSSRSFDTTAETASIIGEICISLSGLPLALELAASQCDVMSPKEVQNQLAGSPATRSEIGRPYRHGSLDQMVDWSLALLRPRERELFERMSVFAGRVDRSAVSAVCAFDDDSGLTEALRTLSNASLIIVETTGERARYGQLPPLRQVGRRRLSPETLASAKLTHAQYFLGLADPPATTGAPGQSEWLDLIDASLEEIRVALELTSRSDPASSLRAATTLGPFWLSRNEVSEGRQHIHKARMLSGDATDAEIAAALKMEGTLAHRMVELDIADRLLAESVERYMEAGDLTGAAAALNNHGLVAVDSGNLDAAFDRYQQARQFFETQAMSRGLATTALNLGIVALQREDSESAEAWFLRALDEFRSLDNQHEEAHTMQRLADVAAFRDDVDGARKWLHAARKLNRELDIPQAVAETDWRLADVSLQADEVQSARTLTRRAARTALSFDHYTWWTPGLLETAARIAALTDKNHLAARLAGAANCFRTVMNLSRPAMANEFYEAFFDELRRELGDEYQVEFLEGELLSVSEALSLLTTEFTSPKGP